MFTTCFHCHRPTMPGDDAPCYALPMVAGQGAPRHLPRTTTFTAEEQAVIDAQRAAQADVILLLG